MELSAEIYSDSVAEAGSAITEDKIIVINRTHKLAGNRKFHTSSDNLYLHHKFNLISPQITICFHCRFLLEIVVFCDNT